MNTRITNILRLNIVGTETHYQEKIWVDDTNEDDGGTFQLVRKKYDKPKIILDFVGEVNVELETGATYTDGTNLFRAIYKNKIQNVCTVVDSFTLPTELKKIFNVGV